MFVYAQQGRSVDMPTFHPSMRFWVQHLQWIDANQLQYESDEYGCVDQPNNQQHRTSWDVRTGQTIHDRLDRTHFAMLIIQFNCVPWFIYGPQYTPTSIRILRFLRRTHFFASSYNDTPFKHTSSGLARICIKNLNIMFMSLARCRRLRRWWRFFFSLVRMNLRRARSAHLLWDDATIMLYDDVVVDGDYGNTNDSGAKH